jgi:hypothetical protein
VQNFASKLHFLITLYSVVPIFIPCAIDGGLSKTRTRFRWIFDKNIQDGGDIRVGRKSIFYLKNSKIEIFQKTLPRFAVLSSTNFLQKSVFENLSK